MLQVGLKNFTQEVIKHQGLVVVDFWADYCQPCRRMQPVIQKIAQTTDLKIVTLDVVEEPELTEHYEVGGVPTLLVFLDGKVVNKHTGFLDEQKILDLVNNSNKN